MGFLQILLTTTAALAGIYFGAEFAKRNDPAGAETNNKAAHHSQTAPRFVAPDIIVYPLQKGNALGGYVVFRFAMAIGNASSEVPLLQDDILLADAFYASMFRTRNSADMPDKLPDPDEIAGLFLDEANRSAGSKRFEAALLQQFDVFEPDAVRRKNVRERKTSEPEPKAKSASSH
jgi:hypothetical protein